MKRFTFTLNLTENDVSGDEFWEQAVEKDGTGITDLRTAIANSLIDSNLLHNHTEEEVKEMIVLTEYTDK